MSLLRVSALRAAAAASPSPCPSAGPGWLPSHVQVTVVAARGLRLKGGPGDAFAVLQLGRQKHRTSVATLRGGGGGGGPRWGEEVALELPPAAPEETDAAALLLQLTVWQRALVGLDRFLGRAVVPLGALLLAGRSHPDQWHKLHSKPGKKEKERGEIQVSIHFTRHSLTASMFDLSVKDKPRSPFGKLRAKMKGRRQYDLESASAIIPSSSGALEEDLSLGGKKATGGGSFFKSKLRKSSLTQSSLSLGSDSTVSSAGSVAAMGGLGAGAAPSPGRHGSLPADCTVRDLLPSPKLTHKRAFSDEVSQISSLPESRSIQTLKPHSEPLSRSSLCINGSHIYCEEPSPRPAVGPPSVAAAPPSTPKKPAESFSPGPLAPDPELPPWSGVSSFQRPPQRDPPRFIPSPPILAAQEEDKLSVKTLALSKHRSRAKAGEGAPAAGRPVQIAVPMVFSAGAGRGRAPEEAQKEKRVEAGLFARGGSKEDAGKSRGTESVGLPEGEKSSSWFSMTDTQDPGVPRPSCPQPGLLAATEACEDRGPSAFPRAGAPRPEPGPPGTSASEPPLDRGDPFDAFATSRLRPGAPRELPLRLDVAREGLSDGGCREEEASPPHTSAGPPPRQPGRPEGEGSPARGPGETEAGGESQGEQPGGTGVESRPRPPPSRAPDWEEPPPAAVEAATEAGPWGEATAAGTPAPSAGSRLPPDQAVEGRAIQESPPDSPPEGRRGWPAVPPLRASLAAEAEAGEGPSGAAGPQREAPQLPPAPGPQLPTEAHGLCDSAAAEGRGQPSEGQEQGGEGSQGTEAAPPKPPRRFTPLNLEEEADEAVAGQGPCGAEGSAPGESGVGQGTQHLLLPAAGGGPAGAQELVGPAHSLGDSEWAAEEGAGGAEQPQACPGQPLTALSLGLASPWVPGPLSGAEAGGPWPSGAPLGLEPSPTVLFWTALEEQLLQSSTGASPEQARGLSEGLSELEPSLEQGGGAAFTSPGVGPTLGQGPGCSVASDGELSSSWSDDRVVDFKKADFWQPERGGESSAPGNPFACRLSPQKNPFVQRPPDARPALQASPAAVPSSCDLHAEAAPQGLLPAASSEDQPGAPVPHGHQPLAFSTPSLEEEAGASGGFAFPSPIGPPAPSDGSAATGFLPTRLSPPLPSPNMDAVGSAASPVETQPADGVPVQQTTSPHLVRPISVPRPMEKQRRSSLPLGQEKLKPAPTSSDPPAPPVLPLEKMGLKRDLAPLECSGKYQHLTHGELIQLLLRREAELSKKQEHIRELENYIDRLLVRIMEQSPTLLQIPLGGGVRAAK
ncbi:rab11 family-interacting protein 5 isoform X2 [Paroedura picta]|uniref:rab11 family-interacting protein 5 isoform X2 n=1 Tax=Paroedura picta TaxID=143630 RepID=UPI004056C09B